jgi:hypothetical protein
VTYQEFAFSQKRYAATLASRKSFDLLVPVRFDSSGTAEHLCARISRDLIVHAGTELFSPKEDDAFRPAPLAYFAEMTCNGPLLSMSWRELIQLIRKENHGFEGWQVVVFFVFLGNGTASDFGSAENVNDIADDEALEIIG